MRRTGAVLRYQAESQAHQRLESVSPNMDQERIIAVGLLTRQDLSLLGPTFSRAWPVEEAPDFHELLTAIDGADDELRHKAGASDRSSRRKPRQGS